MAEREGGVPRGSSRSGDLLSLSKAFRFVTDGESGILSRAAARYEGYIVTNATGLSDALQNCSVSVASTEERYPYCVLRTWGPPVPIS